VQPDDDQRVSEPAVALEITRPTTGFARTPQVDAQIVERDAGAAYDEHAGQLRAFAITATRDRDAADDVVQEAFLRLVLELKDGRVPTNIGGWLHRVSANLIVSRGRRLGVADRMRALLNRTDAPLGPEAQVLANERDRTLALALSRLPADARVALLLAARGMGAAEIGLVIRRTPSATRTYLCRSRVRLRDELSALGIGADR
jgi:RNA polymerase sigma-70 factor (ECF subfamily)